ncbi:MAG: fructose-bisphosphate aldolase [Phycisphaeraceae bacterium]|nr:fructose-bisphosphate aldolase [Phycisphaeraceae bacterium]
MPPPKPDSNSRASFDNPDFPVNTPRMPIVNAADIVTTAHEEGYAVVQVNTNGGNDDLTRAIVEVADEMRSPVILGAYEANLAYRGVEYAAMVMRWYAERADAPVAVHLDHGSRPDVCRAALDAGFTSVMIDGSHLPIDENIALVRQVVDDARSAGAGVEAEVGELQRLDPDGSMSEVKNLSDPAEVARICRETGLDMLAVGIGNAHGFYRGRPDIRLDLLETLAEAATVPLVLHGGTGLERDVVAGSIERGIAKVNLGTLIRTRYVQFTADAIAAQEHQNHPWRVAQVVVERVKPLIREFLEYAGSANRV